MSNPSDAFELGQGAYLHVRSAIGAAEELLVVRQLVSPCVGDQSLGVHQVDSLQAVEGFRVTRGRRVSPVGLLQFIQLCMSRAGAGAA